MCVVSNVSDHYWDRFRPFLPEPQPFDWSRWNPQPSVDLGELARLIQDFKEAMAAAKTVDRLTKQPDCVDPEKAKLLDRVAELERRLAEIEARP
jgi:hypothetical protein